MRLITKKWLSKSNILMLFIHRASLFVVVFFMILLASIFCFSENVKAASNINKQINYQANLFTSAQLPVTDGAYSIVFNLYPNTGTACSTVGASVWNETQSVTTTNGHFSAMLGSVSVLTGVNFNQVLCLGVKVGTDAEMTPKKILGAVPAAFESAQLEGLTWEVPGTIGSTTPNTGKFTTLEAANTANALVLSGAGANIAFTGAGLAQITTAANQNLALMPGGTGSVMVGLSGPTTKFQVVNNTDNQKSYFDSYGVNNASYLFLRTAHGTAASPTSIISGNTLGGLYFGGQYDSTPGNFNNQAGIAGLATENWTSGAGGAGLSFATTANGGLSRTSKMFIDNSGNIGIGSGDTTVTQGKLVISDSTDSAGFAGLRIDQSGDFAGTEYGLYVSKTGAATTNVGGYFSATGATNNYGLVVENGAVGIGTASPSNTVGIDLNKSGSLTTGLQIESSWSTDIKFMSPTPTIAMPNNATMSLTDGTNNLLQAKDLSTNFGLAMNAGAFIDRNSYFGEEFDKFRTAITPGAALGVTGVQGAAMGDGGGWGVATTANGACTVSIPASTINGVMQVTTLAAASRSCIVGVDEGYVNPNLTLRKIINPANLPVMLFKMKSDLNIGTPGNTNNIITIGVGDKTAASITGLPTNFIGFTNLSGNGGAAGGTTNWYGRVNTGAGAYTEVSCGAINNTAGTSQYALGMIEVVSPALVRFYMDTNVSDGINLTQCGADITTNIPAVALAPEVETTARALATVNKSLYMDFYRIWQDDNPNSTPSLIDVQKISTNLNKESNIALAFETRKKSIDPGNIISFNNDNNNPIVDIAKEEERSRIVGISTDSYANSMGTIYADSDVKIAFTGRANVKVNSEGGDIKSGDWLTISSTDGVAMKAKDSGMMIGRAMEDWNSSSGKDTILVLLDVTAIDIGMDLSTLFPQNSISDTSTTVASPSNGLSGDSSINKINTNPSAPVNLNPAFGGVVVNPPDSSPNNLLQDIAFKGKALFSNIVAFFGDVFFNAKAIFNGPTYFNDQVYFSSDSAGYIKLKKGETEKKVEFIKEYEFKPIINLTLKSDIKLDWYRVKEVTTKDFTLEISPASQDKELEFYWTATEINKDWEKEALEKEQADLQNNSTSNASIPNNAINSQATTTNSTNSNTSTNNSTNTSPPATDSTKSGTPVPDVSSATSSNTPASTDAIPESTITNESTIPTTNAVPQF